MTTPLAERITKLAAAFIFQDKKPVKAAAHGGEGKPKKHPKPAVSHEKSRNQFLVRVPGAKSQSFGYTGGAGVQKKAESDAWAHLLAKCREMGLEAPKKAKGKP